MYDQRKEDKCLRIAAFGYEAGLFGAEGRGLYAGGTLAGVHAELSHLEDGPDSRSSWGLQENVYFGIGNNSNDEGLDGKTKSMVKWEIWLPSLGVLGHFTFGRGYDVSNEGLLKSQYDEIISILKNSSNPEDIAVKKEVEIALNARKNLDTKNFLRVGRALRRNGFELIERMGDHSDKSVKYTFRKDGSSEYGNIEFMSRVWNNDAYSSYNYGNNFITHFLIDYLGWKGRGY